MSALVIGTMSPDYEYFFQLAPRGHYGHHLAGVFTFCLPVSLFAWLLFVRLARPALVGLLPSGARPASDASRLPSGWMAYLGAILAVLVGAFSHLAWDSFTHAGGAAVQVVPALRRVVDLPLLGSLVCYQLFQHLSTAVGLVSLAWWAWRAWQRLPADARRFSRREAARARRVALALSLTATGGCVLNGARVWAHGSRSILGFAAVGGMVALVLATLVFAVLAQGRPRRPAAPRLHSRSGG